VPEPLFSLKTDQKEVGGGAAGARVMVIVYLVTADSFLGSQIPDLDSDWIGVSHVPDLENYATCEADKDGIIIDFKNKQKTDYCQLAFTGVLGILNYKSFWEKFEAYKNLNPEKEIELVGALYKPFYSVIHAKNIDWVDIGRKKLYNNFYLNSKNFVEYDLKKIDVEEYIYKIDKKVLKISTILSLSRMSARIRFSFVSKPSPSIDSWTS
jgi:hypothetical protein